MRVDALAQEGDEGTWLAAIKPRGDASNLGTGDFLNGEIHPVREYWISCE